MPFSSSRSLISLIAVAVFIASMTAWALISSQEERRLDVLGTLPTFELINENKESFTLDNLLGRISVANFIFTSCQGTCPLLTRQMKNVADWMKSQDEGTYQIVSISVDSKRDTPERLHAYKKTYGIESEDWHFLTGNDAALKALVLDGFKISFQEVADMKEEPSLFDIVHGEKFVVIDRQGQIRGYFSADRRGIQQLIAALARLNNS